PAHDRTRGIGDCPRDGACIYLRLERNYAEHCAERQSQRNAKDPGMGRSVHELSFELLRLAARQASSHIRLPQRSEPNKPTGACQEVWIVRTIPITHSRDKRHTW